MTWVGLICSAVLLTGLYRADSAPTLPIEQLRVGDRVVVDAPKEALAADRARLVGLEADWSASALNVEGISDPLRELASEAPEETLAQADYRKLILRAQDVWPDGTIDQINIETLQPWQWIQKHEAHVGAWISLPLDVEEMGVSPDLTCRVTDILPCPKLNSGPGRLVLTTVDHLNRDVHELRLRNVAGHEETLRPTGTHRFYSVTRGEWLPASQLQHGEALDGLNGKVTVVASRPAPGAHRVYNITVQGEHLYRVATSGVLVHNNCKGEGPAPAQYGSTPNTNPGFPSPQRKRNCRQCAIALDRTMAGYPASALPAPVPWDGGGLEVVTKNLGGKFFRVDGLGTVEDVMRTLGPGSRGIVAGSRVVGPGHVFNVVVKKNGRVVFLDGQKMSKATTSGFVAFQLLITETTK